MKRLSLALTMVALRFCAVSGHAADAHSRALPKDQVSQAHFPLPPYPYQARQRGLTGDGICRVSFDASGHLVKVVMSTSTGSDILDENTLNFARKNWTGQPNLVTNVPVSYKLTGGLPAKLTGSGSVRVTFDATGHVSKIAVVKSVGSALLDKNTLEYGRANWKGQPNSTVIVPITYKLQ